MRRFTPFKILPTYAEEREFPPIWLLIGCSESVRQIVRWKPTARCRVAQSSTRALLGSAPLYAMFHAAGSLVFRNRAKQREDKAALFAPIDTGAAYQVDGILLILHEEWRNVELKIDERERRLRWRGFISSGCVVATKTLRVNSG